MTDETKTKLTAAVAKLIEMDRDHLVRIKRDFCAGTVKDCPGPFACEDFEIFPDGKFVVYATETRPPVIDGATWAPDRVLGLDLAKGYIIHDLMYYHMEKLCDDWGMPRYKVRKVADAMLCNCIEKESKGKGWFYRNIGYAVSRIYYGAVRAFGGIAHWIGRRKTSALVFILASMLAGCAGCAVPDVFDPSDEEPEYEVVEREAR